MTDECADTGVDCSEVLASLELYLDGELADASAASLAIHLGECPPCSGRATVEEHVRRLLRSKCSDSAPPALVERLHSKLALWSTGRPA